MNPTTQRSETRGGEASSRHQPLRRPGHEQQTRPRLEEVSLEDHGEAIEDELRDRRSSGQPRHAEDG
jgi:hypothetical protein